MRKLLAFFPLVLIPLIVGFGLRFDGNPTVRYAGNFILFVVLPLTAVAYVAVALALIMTGKLKLGTDEPVKFAEDNEAAVEEMNAARAEERIEEINCSQGLKSQIAQAQFVAEQSAHAYGASSLRGKIWGWAFYSVCMLSFAAIPCFLFFKIYIGAIVCGAAFIAAVLIAILLKTVGKSISEAAYRRSYRKEPSAWIEARGRVVKCVMNALSSSGGQDTYSAVRVTAVNYRITATVNGRTYIGYTSRFFNMGDEIDVQIPAKGKSTRMHIL